MTKELLRNYRNIKSHVKMLKSQRDDLILRSSTAAGENVTHSRAAKPVEDITGKREKLERKIKDGEVELAVIRQYVDGCEETIGTMIRLHYILGKSWTNVAIRAGGNNTKDSVRMMCHRYIEKNP